MLPMLLDSIKDWKKEIEVIVSDNCSTDETNNFLQNFGEKYSSQYNLVIKRNHENIGVSKNITQLFALSKSEYFMFLGDDDKIYKEAFEKVLPILKSNESPSAIIQTEWDWIPSSRKVGLYSWKESIPYFYEYGNAWAGIIKREAALDAVLKRNILNKAEQTVWPQTIMAFLAMYDLSDKKVYLADFKIGSRIAQGFNVINREYYIKSLIGLLEALQIITLHTGDSSFKKLFLSYKNYGFQSHMKGMFLACLLFPYEKDIRIIKAMDNIHGFRAWFYKNIFKLIEYPQLIKLGALMIYCIRNFSMPSKYFNYIDTMRDSYLQKQKEFNEKSIRYDDWF